MNKEVLSQSLLTEYMLLQHKYSMLIKSLGYRHPTDEVVRRLALTHFEVGFVTGK